MYSMLLSVHCSNHRSMSCSLTKFALENGYTFAAKGSNYTLIFWLPSRGLLLRKEFGSKLIPLGLALICRGIFVS